MIFLHDGAENGVRLDDLLLGGKKVLHVRGVVSGPTLIAKDGGRCLTIDINDRGRLIERSQALGNDHCGNYGKSHECNQLPAVALNHPEILGERRSAERRFLLKRRKNNRMGDRLTIETVAAYLRDCDLFFAHSADLSAR
jgi:hypothetical protein